MERNTLANKVRKISNVKDLAQLLCEIQKSEFGTTSNPIHEKQLLYFCNSGLAKKRYKTFQIPKKRGGTREISSPTYQLKCILHVLNIMLCSLYTPRPSTMGFVEGRSVVRNADVHKGHRYVLNIDLSDFFPSIRQSRVWACLQLEPFCFSERVASVIAGLCCNVNKEGTDNVLPQGAPTSPLLSNIVCTKLDKRLEGVARRFGLHYSRYADDMTFSAMYNAFHEDGEFMTELRRIIKGQGFALNDAKTRLIKDGFRQEVTGLIVNEKVNVTKKYIRQLRFFLFKWQNEGYAHAYALFYRIYKKEKGYIKKGEPVMENVIGGKLDYLKMVKGENDSTYQTLRKWYNRLQQVVFVDADTDKGYKYVYVQPYSVPEFERLFETSLRLEKSKKGKLFAKCTLFGKERIISISANSQDIICGNINSYNVGETIHSSVLNDCYVTLCQSRGKQVKNFWLITRKEPQRSKCLSLQNVHFEVDDIDTLLSVWKESGIDEAASLFNDAINGGDKLKEVTKFQVKKNLAKLNKPLGSTTSDEPIDELNPEDIPFLSL